MNRGEGESHPGKGGSRGEGGREQGGGREGGLAGFHRCPSPEREMRAQKRQIQK